MTLYVPSFPIDAQNTVYITGFTITPYEWEKTVTTLWDSVKGELASLNRELLLNVPCSEFMRKYPQYISLDNAMDYLSDDGGESYNLCHCRALFLTRCSAISDSPQLVWSNFEIADMDFWRGEAYSTFFEFLDQKGGFYYEVRFLKPISVMYSRPGEALGRCSCAQHWRGSASTERSNPFL